MYELYHSGIKGQKWGVRRYQNEDGSLTAAGKERYYKTEYKPAAAEYKTAKAELRKAKKGYNKKFDSAQKYDDKKYDEDTSNERVKNKHDKKWAEVDKAESRYEAAIEKYNSSKADYKEKRKQVWDNIDKKKLAAGATAVAATALTAYVMSDPGRRKAVKDFAAKAGKATVDSMKSSSKKAGKAMIEGAFASAGLIAVNKLSKKMEASPDASEAVKNRNQIAFDSVKAGIETATKANKYNSAYNKNSNQNGAALTAELRSKVGTPTKKEAAQRDPQWAGLMNDLRGNESLRIEAKALAKAGYDIDQIKAYIYGNSNMQHSERSCSMHTEQICNNSLYHHGIKGQKWGIRRYQNYDGSLTQKGMKRYNTSLEKYNKADESYKESKKAYKEGTGTKADLVNKRMARKDAKNRLDKDYKHLKQDKLADKGKERYSKGQTITNGREKLSTVTSLAGTVAVGSAYLSKMGVIKQNTAKKILLGTTVATGATYIGEIINEQTRNKQLRAYYSHTSKY